MKDATGNYTVGFVAMVAMCVLNFVIALFAKDSRAKAPELGVQPRQPAAQ